MTGQSYVHDPNIKTPPNDASKIEFHLCTSASSVNPTRSLRANGSTGTTRFCNRTSEKTATQTTEMVNVFEVRRVRRCISREGLSSGCFTPGSGDGLEKR